MVAYGVMGPCMALGDFQFLMSSLLHFAVFLFLILTYTVPTVYN